MTTFGLPTDAGLRFDYRHGRFVGSVDGIGTDHEWSRELMPEITHGVTGMCTQEQADMLFDLAQRADPRGAIVEIGSLEGYTAIYLGWASKTGGCQPVYCVDPHDGDLGVRTVEPTWEAFLRNLDRAGVSDVVRPVRTSSTIAAASFTDRVSFCYIDALHDYESVRSDWESWAVHLLDGAIVAFDDAVDDFPGVQRLERELRDDEDCFVYEGRLPAGFYGRWRR